MSANPLLHRKIADLETYVKAPEPERWHEGDERWELVLRITASAGFRRAPRLREFLIYACDRALCGGFEDLTEQHVGIEVFKRQPDYSTTEDNIVRAQARQLRIKLAEYYAAEGAHEALVLEIPKGSYIPLFTARSEPVGTLQPQAGAAELSAVTQAPETPLPALLREPRRISLTLALIALAAVCAAAFAFVLWDRNSAHARSTSESAPALLPPFSWIFDSHQPVTLVVADSSFGLYQDLIGRAATLDEYLKPEFFATNPPQSKDKQILAFAKRLGTRQFSSYADLELTQQLLQLATARGQKISVRFARDLHLREIPSGNFIFIGSPYSNPWVSLFAKRRNFPTSLDARSRRGVVTNRQPQGPEPDQFLMKGEDGMSGSTFGVLAFLPADAESGNVLLLDGLNMEGTEAAGAFLTEWRAAQSLLERMHLKPDSAKRYFEAVVETKAIAGTTRDSTLVAYRLGDPVP